MPGKIVCLNSDLSELDYAGLIIFLFPLNLKYPHLEVSDVVQGRKVDSLHAYLQRINGCIYLGLAVIPWIGQRFRYSEDKHTVLLARILVSWGVWIGLEGVGARRWNKFVCVCVCVS